MLSARALASSRLLSSGAVVSSHQGLSRAFVSSLQELSRALVCSLHQLSCFLALLRSFHSFVLSFFLSYVLAFARSCLMRLCVRAFFLSCLRPLPSCVRAFVHSCIRAFVRSQLLDCAVGRAVLLCCIQKQLRNSCPPRVPKTIVLRAIAQALVRPSAYVKTELRNVRTGDNCGTYLIGAQTWLSSTLFRSSCEL